MFCVLFLAGSQYGALVVSMADQAGEGETTEGQAGEGKDATIAVPALTEGAREFDKNVLFKCLFVFDNIFNNSVCGILRLLK